MPLIHYVVDFSNVPKSELETVYNQIDNFAFASHQKDIYLWDIFWSPDEVPIEKLINFPKGTIINKV